MVDTKINLLSTEIDNPIIPASGTFGFGYDLQNLRYQLLRLSLL